MPITTSRCTPITTTTLRGLSCSGWPARRAGAGEVRERPTVWLRAVVDLRTAAGRGDLRVTAARERARCGAAVRRPAGLPVGRGRAANPSRPPTGQLRAWGAGLWAGLLLLRVGCGQGRASSSPRLQNAAAATARHFAPPLHGSTRRLQAVICSTPTPIQASNPSFQVPTCYRLLGRPRPALAGVELFSRSCRNTQVQNPGSVTQCMPLPSKHARAARYIMQDRCKHLQVLLVLAAETTLQTREDVPKGEPFSAEISTKVIVGMCLIKKLDIA